MQRKGHGRRGSSQSPPVNLDILSLVTSRQERCGGGAGGGGGGRGKGSGRINGEEEAEEWMGGGGG